MRRESSLKAGVSVVTLHSTISWHCADTEVQVECRREDLMDEGTRGTARSLSNPVAEAAFNRECLQPDLYRSTSQDRPSTK